MTDISSSDTYTTLATCRCICAKIRWHQSCQVKDYHISPIKNILVDIKYWHNKTDRFISTCYAQPAMLVHLQHR
jgi:hypothetical protein